MKRYYFIDFFRGISALIVMLSHYGHFFQYRQNSYPEDWSNSSLPFYQYLSLFYDHGGKAVELFFCISGFIFFMFYFKQVSSRSISGLNFFLLRFSRLYPLHLLTLFITLIINYVFYNQSGFYFLYPENDLWHFALQILLISHWGLASGNSFNGPIWSVSIEIFLYTAFFLLSYYLRSFLAICFLGIFLGSCLILFYDSFGIAIVCFFLGGLIYKLYDSTPIKKPTKLIVSILLLLIFSSLAIYLNPMNFYERTLDFIAFFFIFPLFILFLAFFDDLNLNFIKKGKIIGDISYSVYLIHFPIQLIVVTICILCGIDINFYSAYLLLAYFIVTIFISYLTYKFFEIPLQKFFRRFLTT